MALRARWESDGEAGRLALEVATGIGMTLEQMGRLFRHEQADAATSSRFGGRDWIEHC